jgi:hypothetical protein
MEERELQPTTMRTLLGLGCLRVINHVELFKDTQGKWMTTPLRRGEDSFARWLVVQKGLRLTKREIETRVSPSSLTALHNCFSPMLLDYDRDFTEIVQDVNNLLNQDLTGGDRIDILNHACHLLNQGLIYFQGENKFYQILRQQGRLVLESIEKSAHSFKCTKQVPLQEGKRSINRQTGEEVIKWKYGPFYNYYLNSDHPRYQYREWSPEALNPTYDSKKLAGNFNAFSGFKRDGSHFIKMWEENQNDRDLAEKVNILRDWVRIGICGGQVPFKARSKNYEKFTTQYLEFLEMLIKNMIMYPWNRSGVFVVMYGDQGTGKGWLVNTLSKRIYGDNSPLFRSVTNADHVFGHYSLDGENQCLMMFFDETEINTKAHIASLKNATTETNRNANYKFKAQAQVQTWWQGFLATNSPTPVLIRGNERRIFVVCTKLIENTVFPHWIQSIVNDPLVFDLWLGRICSSYPQVTDQWHAQSARPQTFAYHNLKIRSFSPLSSWWLNCLRQGWHTVEPETHDAYYYRLHQSVPSMCWVNNNPRSKWNDLVSKEWLFQTYYVRNKEFVSMKGYNKGGQDDPLNKFCSELIPMIHGPKFGLSNIPTTNSLLVIPDLKTCVLNFCKFHFISDPSVLQIQSIQLPKVVHQTEEEETQALRDPWQGMKRIIDKKLKRAEPHSLPRPTPMRSNRVVTPSPSPPAAIRPVSPKRKDKEPDSESEEEEDEELGPTPPPLNNPRKKQKLLVEEDEYDESFIDDSAYSDDEDEVAQALEELHEIHEEMGVEVKPGEEEAVEEPFDPNSFFSVTEEGERERGKELSTSEQNPFLYE